MDDYPSMRSMEQHLGNEMSTTMLLQLGVLWRSPRGTVLRIEALALIAIVLSFFLATFGSCRRWSNHWIVQKGFLAAQVLSLSLGTYSIGLMQSSSVKSEMYPIWAVSLLTLFGCIDPITTYIGLDYKGPFLKMIFQLCLYCGYVLLMSVSTISGVVGNLAIVLLSAITFIKGFHRSLALVLPSKMRDELAEFGTNAFICTETGALAGFLEALLVHLPVHILWRKGSSIGEGNIVTTMADIHSSCNEMLGELQMKEVTANDIEDVCLGYSLSHLLQRRFLGLDTAGEMERKRGEFELTVKDEDGHLAPINYKRTLKAIEVELAFLYEVFFTSNGFLHYHEAKTSSFWAVASLIGICFVGVATAIPGTMTSRHRITSATGPAGAGSVVIVDTTTADLIVTLVILVSLVLLQVMQLIRCWTSNWARVAFACEYARKGFRQEAADCEEEFMSPERCEEQISTSNSKRKQIWQWAMRSKAFVVTRMNWFDKDLWQDELGQYSLVDAVVSRKREFGRACCLMCFLQVGRLCRPVGLYWACHRLPRMLGLPYIAQVLRELFACDTSKTVRLHDDVKTSIANFLGQIKSTRIGVEWMSLLVDNGLDASYLPYSGAPFRPYQETKSGAYAFSHRILMWHVATCYCQLAEPQERGGEGSSHTDRERNRRVAIDLSRYCTYLVVSAPELLPGPSAETKRACKQAVTYAREAESWPSTSTLVEAMQYGARLANKNNAFGMGVYWGMRLLNETPPAPDCTPPSGCTRRCSDDHWKVLARLWVQTLLYAAPYGNVEAHMQHLSQGGEFITHLWALLYHLGIDKWEREEADRTGEATEAGAGDATEAEAQARETEAEPEIEEIN